MRNAFIETYNFKSLCQQIVQEHLIQEREEKKIQLTLINMKAEWHDFQECPIIVINFVEKIIDEYN